MRKYIWLLFAVLLAVAPALGAFAEGEAAVEKPKVAAENTTQAQADDPGTDAPSLDYDSDSGDE